MYKNDFFKIEKYMLDRAEGTTHGSDHIYRVLYRAIDISRNEINVDNDVVTAACLLHDIARTNEDNNPNVCHAKLGSEMAFEWLIKNNILTGKARHISNSILTHRYRAENPPETIEAKILYDADKLDVSGLIGIARTFTYCEEHNRPLYLSDGSIIFTDKKDGESFISEYKYKLEKIHDRLFTERAKELSEKLKKTADEFYNNFYNEIKECHENGVKFLLK